MQRSIVSKSGTLTFYFQEVESIWIADLKLDSRDITFEIHHPEIEKDTEDLVKRIQDYIADGKFPKADAAARELLNGLSSAFWQGEIVDPAFSLSGITIGFGNAGQDVDFELVYNMSSASKSFDDFANWIVNFKSFRVVGGRREQI
jgi:hypothetical protein